ARVCLAGVLLRVPCIAQDGTADRVNLTHGPVVELPERLLISLLHALHESRQVIGRFGAPRRLLPGRVPTRAACGSQGGYGNRFRYRHARLLPRPACSHASLGPGLIRLYERRRPSDAVQAKTAAGWCRRPDGSIE